MTAATPTFDDLLDSVPVPNQAVRAEPHRAGGLVLRVPIRKRWYMNPPFSWLMPFRQTRSLGLDRLGREVWQLCDGDRRTEAVIDTFAAAHRLTFHEGRLAVTQYLQTLTRNGLLAMVGRDEADGAGDDEEARA